ncbi:MAG: hypothetical protein U9R05_05965 [Chloroflexota bacterium]|nr:hypothetical protein [Chloroflexota bacterium]
MAYRLTVSEIIDDLRVADEMLRRFERLYRLSSDQFFELYDQGLLDDGEHLHDFSQWAGFYKLRQRRLEAFNRVSQERVTQLRITGVPIQLERLEMLVEPA